MHLMRRVQTCPLCAIDSRICQTDLWFDPFEPPPAHSESLHTNHSAQVLSVHFTHSTSPCLALFLHVPPCFYFALPSRPSSHISHPTLGLIFLNSFPGLALATFATRSLACHVISYVNPWPYMALLQDSVCFDSDGNFFRGRRTEGLAPNVHSRSLIRWSQRSQTSY